MAYKPVGIDEASRFPPRVEARLAADFVTADEYTIAVIPDTQFLSQDYPAHFTALANYLDTNAAALNLAAILHAGDVVNTGNSTQYNAALPAMQTLRDIGVPFLTAIGNHDQESGGGPSRTATLWNSYFGTAFYAAGDHPPVLKDSGKTENGYVETTLGSRPTLIFTLEWYPRDAVMAWANTVVAAHPNHDILVVTHGYLDGVGNRVTWTSTYGPQAYSLVDAHSGEDMWRDHLSHWRNLVGVFCGHYLPPGNLAHRYDFGSGGNAVLQQMSNWQQSTEGGQGRVVLLTINPATGSARRRVYTAALGTFDTTAGYERTLSWGRGNQAPGAQVNATARALYLPGVSGEYASCPDSNAQDVANVEYVADITPASWNPASQDFVIGKWSNATQKHSMLSLDTGGFLSLYYSFDGATTNSIQSSVAVPFAAGERGRLRVKRVGTSVTFYTARPGEPWTQLGTVRTIAATALFTGTSAVVIGDLVYLGSGNVWSFNGLFHSAEMRDPSARTTLAAIRFDVPFNTRYRDEPGNLWTLTGTAYAWQRPSLVNV